MPGRRGGRREPVRRRDCGAGACAGARAPRTGFQGPEPGAHLRVDGRDTEAGTAPGAFAVPTSRPAAPRAPPANTRPGEAVGSEAAGCGSPAWAPREALVVLRRLAYWGGGEEGGGYPGPDQPGRRERRGRREPLAGHPGPGVGEAGSEGAGLRAPGTGTGGGGLGRGRAATRSP